MLPRITANTRFVSEAGPWSPRELELIIASAKTLPGLVGDIPARHWWPAFLLVLLDTAEPPKRLLALHRDAYDVSCGELAIGARVYRLHLHSASAARAILPHSQPNLFPWPFDARRVVLHMLVRKYKEILFRADLPYVTANLFSRLLLTAQQQPEILARLDLGIPFRPREGKPVFSRARDRRQLPEIDRSKSGRASWVTRRRRDPEIIRIQIEPGRTLLQFLETSYRPLRLADAAPDSIYDYRHTIDYLGWFCACDATFQNLTDDCAERFMAWLKSSGLSNATINGHRARLLALWRHAWRKRRVDEQPRDVQKYRESKHMPEAWSTEEVTLILKTAAATEGGICGIPAGDWWPALILVMYDTGLRVDAVMKINTDDLNSSTRYLSVPAENQKQNADQAFQLHPDTLAAILRTHPDRRDRLFPWPYELQTLGKRYRKILRLAGLPCGKRDLFHKIRRTSGTAVAAATDEQTAQRHLGHSSPSVTKRYIDPRKLTNRQTDAEKIERPGWRIVRDDDSENAAAG